MTEQLIPKELQFSEEIAPGTRGGKARLVQEWLCLNGHAVVIDGAFGPATRAAVRAFQERSGLTASGRVNRSTFIALTQPARTALQTPDRLPDDIGEAAVAIARRHLAQHPRETGGQNRGPWVRLYMDGHEGADWPWCAGFVCFILRQTCHALGRSLPFPKTYSCDLIAARAQERGLFVRGSGLRAGPDRAATVPPGTVFLNRRVAGDWVHTGLVVAAGADTFSTIEGNTNDEGSREGYEVCARVRGYKDKDFVRLAV